MANNHSEIERRLWASADELRANSKLKSSEYSAPAQGLIFLGCSVVRMRIEMLAPYFERPLRRRNLDTYRKSWDWTAGASA